MSKFIEKNQDNGLSNAQSCNNLDVERLIEEYRSIVEKVARKYINSPLEIDDLQQEGMIGLLSAIRTYDSRKGAGFKTYAYACVDNSIQTALRKFNRLKDVPAKNIVEYQEEELTEGTYAVSVEDYVIAKESVSLLTKLLEEKLSDFENEVLRLHIVGCSYNEIAKRLSKTPKAVDNALQRIRKKLSAVNV